MDDCTLRRHETGVCYPTGVMEGRTTLIIAYRISSVKEAEIIVLDDGQIVKR